MINKNTDKKVKLDILIKMSTLNNFDINKNLSIRKYIPFEEKVRYIDDFVSNIIDDNGSYNSLDKYFKFTMMMVNVYTNLDLKNTYEEYDKLITSGLLDMIFTEIEADYFDFKEFLEMRFNDRLKKIYSNK